MKLFQAGKFKEASAAFSKWLDSNHNAPDKERKVARYNRARCFHKMGNYEESLRDAETCIKIDPFWAKGYKCKSQALEGMNRPMEAIKVLLDGSKIAEGIDDDYREIIARLNKLTGFLEGDVDLFFRQGRGEKYCVVCEAFEADAKGKEFLSCKKCRMVNYCCKEHKEENKMLHKDVCSKLKKIREDERNGVKLLFKGMDEKGLFLVGYELEGGVDPSGNPLLQMMMRSDPRSLEAMKCFERAGRTNIFPIVEERGFPRVKNHGQIRSWEDWFSLPDNQKLWQTSNMANTLFKMITPSPDSSLNMVDLNYGTKKAFTGALTDAMTVFHALREVKLRGRVLRIHVVGAEPSKEGMTVKCFLAGLISPYFRDETKVTMIGPL